MIHAVLRLGKEARLLVIILLSSVRKSVRVAPQKKKGGKVASGSPLSQITQPHNLTGREGGPCPRSSLNAIHQLIHSISVISQVRKVDPVPAPSLNAIHQQINNSNLGTFKAKLDHEVSVVLLE